MSEKIQPNKTTLTPEEYTRHVEFLKTHLKQLLRRASHQTDSPKKKSRNLADEFIDLHCGPDGVKIPHHYNPWSHLYDAWDQVGSCMRKAMGRF